MSFKSISAILRGNWLIERNWAQSHRPLVISFLNGNAQAGTMIMGNSENDSKPENDNPELVQGTVVAYEVCPGSKISDIPFGAIAYLDIDGPLMKDSDLCSWGMTDYALLMDGLRQAPNVSSIIIDIDSPGGQVDGTATLSDAIRNCTAIKPVIGFINDGMSASAAYWCISQCTEIYVGQPTDEVGSIGVYSTIADWNAYYASQGLPVTDVYSSLSKDKNNDYKEAIKGNEKPLQVKLDFIAQTFIDAVKQGRNGKIKGNDWATGKMYFANDAMQLGLIDGVKNLNQIIKRALELVNSNSFKNNSVASQKKWNVSGTKLSAKNSQNQFIDYPEKNSNEMDFQKELFSKVL